MQWERWAQRANIKGHKVLRLEWDCDKDSLQFDLKMTSNNCLQIVPNKTQHIECTCTIPLVRDCKPYNSCYQGFVPGIVYSKSLLG